MFVVELVPHSRADQLLPRVSSTDGASPGERMAERRVVCHGGGHVHILIWKRRREHAGGNRTE